MSMSDVSDMLFEMYKANVAKAPKNQQPQQPQLLAPAQLHHHNNNNKSGAISQTSPTSAETAHEPSTIAAIATTGAELMTASKNLSGAEMVVAAAPFHPRIKYSTTSQQTTVAASMLQAAVKEAGMQVGIAGAPAHTQALTAMPRLSAIPTSVLVLPPAISATLIGGAAPQTALQEEEEEIDVKPLIHPTTGLVITPIMPPTNAASVIKPVPPAAAIAAALLRDGYHNFQQQLRAQELLKQQQIVGARLGGDTLPSSSNSLLENFLRQQRQAAEQETAAASDTNDGDDEDGDGDDSRYNSCFDELIESTQAMHGSNTGGNGGNGTNSGATAEYFSDESQKFMIAAQVQAQALRNLEYSLGGGIGVDYAANGLNADGSLPDGMLGADGEPVYECRHCGKKYRWKSTLRRHENVECGGKEPMHQCPYCPYKSKQRGNLGVHVRKHHSNLPQLASKRRSKYSTKMEGGGGSSAAGSDDSSSKLVIDCPLGESQFNNNNVGSLNDSMPLGMDFKSQEVQGGQSNKDIALNEHN